MKKGDKFPENGSTEGKPQDNGTIQFAAKEDKPTDYFFGIGSFHPNGLQVFRNAKFFTFLLSCYCLIEGIIATGFVSVVITSIEVRYQLNSTQAGVIFSIFDIAVVVSVIFISFFAGKGHKPRWLGLSIILLGIGSFIFALPQFVFGEYGAGPSEFRNLESCDDGVDFTPDCSVTGKNQYAIIFFYIGNMIIGIGAAALFTVGPAYLDDIVRPKYVSIHLGIFFMCAVIGPAVGYGLGAGFLAVYVDFWVETRLKETDPEWVGAWWLCFLLGAVLSWLLAIPFLMFPKLLPDSHLVKEEREKEMAKTYSGNLEAENKNLWTKLASLPRHIWHVLITPTWVFMTIAAAVVAILESGIVAFAPKFYEIQFYLTASEANIVSSAEGIFTGTIGVVAGALVIYFAKSNGRTVALINWIVIIICAPFLLLYLLYCPTVQLAGVNVPFYNDSVLEEPFGQTLSDCNSQCNCTSSIFEPVCGADDITYFSPCIAGCDKGFIDNDLQQPIFENCTCVAANFAAMNLATNMTTEFMKDDVVMAMSTATQGVCETGCKLLGPFLVLSLISFFLFFIVFVPSIFVTIRCVADEQRSLALGMQSFAFRLFGNIPGPIVFGILYDTACIYFRYDAPCMEFGNCWVYDTYKVSLFLVLSCTIGIVIYLASLFFAWVAYPKQEVASVIGVANPTALEQNATDIPLDTGEKDVKLEAINSQSKLVPN